MHVFIPIFHKKLSISLKKYITRIVRINEYDISNKKISIFKRFKNIYAKLKISHRICACCFCLVQTQRSLLFAHRFHATGSRGNIGKVKCAGNLVVLQ